MTWPNLTPVEQGSIPCPQWEGEGMNFLLNNNSNDHTRIHSQDIGVKRRRKKNGHLSNALLKASGFSIYSS